MSRSSISQKPKAETVPIEAVVYVAHPVGAPTEEGVRANLTRARRWYRWASDHYPEYAFNANWIVEVETYPGADIDPNDPRRLRGLNRDDAIIRTCDHYWMVGGCISSGMNRGRCVAEEWNRRLVDLTYLGEEPPAGRIVLPGTTRVVHVGRDPYDVPIHRPSIWGNPFRLGAGETRGDTIARYETWIRSQPLLLKQIPLLAGKALGCFCFPNKCHGDVLVKLVGEWERGELVV